MTEKDYERKANIEKITTNEFDITTDENNFIVITNNGVELSQIQVCDLLNVFRNENKQLKSEKQAIIDILDEMENGDDFWDRDYLIDRISDIETAIGVDLDD